MKTITRKKITRNFMAVALIAGLSACSSADEKSEENVDVSGFEAEGEAGSADASAPVNSKEIAEKLKKLKIKPGKWKYTITYEKMEMNIDESKFSEQEKAMFEMVKKEIEQVKNQVHKNDICISQEQADNQAAEFFVGQNVKKCTYSRFKADGGELDIDGTCEGVQGSEKAKVTLTGSFTDDKVDSNMTIIGESEFGHRMTIISNIKREFAGACDK